MNCEAALLLNTKAVCTMSDAFIYDHLRTPRGKGKKDGSLHQAAPGVAAAHAAQGAGAPQRSSTPRWSTTWCSAA